MRSSLSFLAFFIMGKKKLPLEIRQFFLMEMEIKYTKGEINKLAFSNLVRVYHI